MTNFVEKILTGQAPAIGTSAALFRVNPVASLIFGRDGLISDANAAACSLFRCERAVLVGDAMTSLFPEIGSSVRATCRATAHRRVAVRRPDGNNFIARLKLVPLDEHAGDAGWLLATVEDLTEYETEIAATNKEFESFTSAAGHDLRGPLRILKGFTEALEEECGPALNDEGRTFLKEILKASDRMEGLIDGMLAMARAGRAEMTCENLDMTTLAELVDYELRHDGTERQIEFKVAPGITGWGDVRLMMTVLRNLLGNAWKYTSRTPHASIRFYTEERDGQTWYCVSDNGAGFDMTHADRLFRPFTRLHRQDEFPGHGLGLATVQRIVKRHGGEILAQAAIKQGATLRFRLQPPPADR
jgi:signal transduction histidine kinase